MKQDKLSSTFFSWRQNGKIHNLKQCQQYCILDVCIFMMLVDLLFALLVREACARTSGSQKPFLIKSFLSK